MTDDALFVQYCRAGNIEDAMTILPRVSDGTAMGGVVAGYVTENMDIIRGILQERPAVREHIDYMSLVVHCSRTASDETIKWAIGELNTEDLHKANNFIYLRSEVKALLVEELDRRALV